MNTTSNQLTRNSKQFCLLMALALAIMVPSASATAAARKTSAGNTKKPNPAMEKIQDNPRLPRVLLIGDSISIGYTLPVRELLKGKANVHRIPANGGPTINGLKNLDSWLGNSKWDVIHFNWGLHDLKYMGTNNENRADPKASTSHQQVPLPEYEKNLKKLNEDWRDSYIFLNSIVERLKSRKKRLEQFNPIGVFMKRFLERKGEGR